MSETSGEVYSRGGPPPQPMAPLDCRARDAVADHRPTRRAEKNTSNFVCGNLRRICQFLEDFQSFLVYRKLCKLKCENTHAHLSIPPIVRQPAWTCGYTERWGNFLEAIDRQA